MSTIPDFSIFTVRSPESAIRRGAAEQLRAQQQIAHFLGATLSGTYQLDGRIYETPTTLIPDGPLPACYVYVVRARRPKLLSHEAEAFVTLGISLVWDEYRDQLGSGDRSCEDFFNCVLGTFSADPGMELCPSGIASRTGAGLAAGATQTGKGLADRLEDSETMDFTYGPSKQPDYVTVERALLVTWSTTVSANTGIPQ